VNQTVQAAVDFAESSALPEPKEALEDIYAPPGAPISSSAPNSPNSAANGAR
jgi:TPP-dependent pyruvate/acetoin dehydrogenase alpha subunit